MLFSKAVGQLERAVRAQVWRDSTLNVALQNEAMPADSSDSDDDDEVCPSYISYDKSLVSATY